MKQSNISRAGVQHQVNKSILSTFKLAYFVTYHIVTDPPTFNPYVEVPGCNIDDLKRYLLYYEFIPRNTYFYHDKSTGGYMVSYEE